MVYKPSWIPIFNIFNGIIALLGIKRNYRCIIQVIKEGATHLEKVN